MCLAIETISLRSKNNINDLFLLIYKKGELLLNKISEKQKSIKTEKKEVLEVRENFVGCGGRVKNFFSNVVESCLNKGKALFFRVFS